MLIWLQSCAQAQISSQSQNVSLIGIKYGIQGFSVNILNIMIALESVLNISA